jgi:Ran GTPase-activating protein (RanGAP) involved in mRNA processing and transport
VLVLDTLPAVETVDLSDNRMTDVSIMPLTIKLRALTTLTHLDLSFNKMDDSSASIMKYISSKDCTLRTLKLNGSDVDDYECCNLCDAMIENFSIETLCLSRNLLGSDEHKRTLKPNLVLAGDGIAKMLNKNKKLTSLDLSWNSLRMSGAVAIGRALKKNKMLKSLFLQFNSFGDLGAQAVGYALKYNKSLQELDLSNNSIVPRSACVLANALSHNSTLVFLNISDNILGRVGSQAVVAAIQRTQDLNRVISFSSCDCTR